MKTTVDIPDNVLREAMRNAGETTIRGTVIAALEWYNHRARQREAIKVLGKLKRFMSRNDLNKDRQAKESTDDRHRQQLASRRCLIAARPRGVR